MLAIFKAGLRQRTRFYEVVDGKDRVAAVNLRIVDDLENGVEPASRKLEDASNVFLYQVTRQQVRGNSDSCGSDRYRTPEAGSWSSIERLIRVRINS
jgi:hypothetical protein